MRSSVRFYSVLPSLALALLSGSSPRAGAQVTWLATGHQFPSINLLDRPARLQVERVPLIDALRRLEQTSGVALAYSPSLLPATRFVSCGCREVTIREALEMLLDETRFTFRETEGQILLVPALRDSDSPRPTARVASLSAGSVALVSEAPVMPEVTRRPADPATIVGTVSTEGGAPITAAAVVLRSLQLSTTTNDAGAFQLVVPADRVVARTDTLVVTRLGYRQTRAPFSLREGRIVVDVVMPAQVVALDQVLVTGTAGNQERRAQPASIATINAADIVAKAPVLNVNELLYARTPGVSLTTASGTAGANTRINIRGQASVSLSNYPLVFIDGIRVVSGPRGVANAPGGGSPGGAGGQQFNALNDLNPEDIESLEIVKGPAAATLYGADASAGVIQILTKKGRAGTRRFVQRATFEYDQIQPNFSPSTNYARCTAALIAPTSTNPLCRGQSLNAVVTDNPLERNDVFNNGWNGSVLYSAQGGGESFGYYASFGGDNTRGTAPGNFLNHRTGRVNFNWIASPTLTFDAGIGVIRADDRMPQGDQSNYGWLINQGFGTPLSVTTSADGSLVGGWLVPSLSVRSVSAIQTEDVTLRTTPSMQVHYTPIPWFSNRITLGSDLTRTSAVQMYPKNVFGWYSAVLNTGAITRAELNTTVHTIDYLGNVNTRLGRNRSLSSDLSFGTQWINTTSETLTGTGQELLTNSANAVSLAITRTAAQGYAQAKSLGFFAQEQVGFNDRLYIQLGARVDRNSAFGSTVGSFFLPKAGVSWVVSEEPVWRSRAPGWMSTFRLRAAYGTTGRSPSAIAALATYIPANYVDSVVGAPPPGTVVRAGVAPGSPGNPDIKPERGVEYEAGFDAGFFHDRVGVELTYFAKLSRDLLLPRPLAPSSGYSSNPLVNIGEVTNKGLEVAVRATPVDGRRFGWDAGLNLNTLRNKIVSMGAITPFVSGDNQCFKPGYEVAAWCVRRVLSVDTQAGRAIVSDTAEYAGGQLPKYEASANSTLRLFESFRLYAQVDGKFDYHVYNLSRDFRDRSFRNSAEAVLTADEGGFSAYERIRRTGPFFSKTSGASVGFALVREPYIVPADFVRLRELSATWTLPARFASRLRVANSSISIGGKNLALWTKYDGYDPEVIGVSDPTTPFLADVYTLPQTRRFFTRLNLQF